MNWVDEDAPLTLPWDRQPGEPARAFQQFVLYRDMGPTRSPSRVASSLSLTRQAVQQKATAWAWVNRCAAWDRHLDRLRLRANEAKLIELAELEVEAGMASLDLGREAIEAMARRLALWTQELDKVTRGEMPLSDLPPCPIRIRDALLLMTHGSELASKGLGLDEKQTAPPSPPRDDTFDSLFTDPKVQEAADAFTQAAAEARDRELRGGS